MGKVISSASMSLDGFVAHQDDTPGSLFDWYNNGEVEVRTAHQDLTFHLTPQSADYWRGWTAGLGVLVVGRRLFNVTDGWGGVHPLDVPVVVLTHDPPADWNYPGSENFSFITAGIEAAVARAQEIAGDRVVGVAAGTVAGQCLAAGLLDEVAIDLVPVVLGSGRRYFGDFTDGATPTLGDPITSIQGNRVTHLVFPVDRG